MSILDEEPARRRPHHSPLRDRSAFLISRLMRTASCEEESISCTQRRPSPSILACCSKYVACRIASRELLKSCASTRRRATSSGFRLSDPAASWLAIRTPLREMGTWHSALCNQPAWAKCHY